jgi:hypothetical protein
MVSQLAKLNEARVALTNMSMGVSDIQFALILLNTLPNSYKILASTILASGAPDTLKHSEIIACIINEEGCRSGSSNSSLNTARAAPIKSSGKKKKDHSDLTCHYCNKKGHIKPDCQKKKKDEAEKKKKEEDSSNGGHKAANSHVQGASITEVDDNDIAFSLYTTNKLRWMMDSGAMHHITPHRSDFATYTLIKGTVCLRDKSTTDQVRVGTVALKTPQDHKILLSDVLHVPSVRTCFLSIGAVADKNTKILFDHKGFTVTINNQYVATGYREDRLYWVNGPTVSLNVHSVATSLYTWHQHMGHMSHAALKSHGPTALKGLDLQKSDLAMPSIYVGCEMGKST